jgi:Leucine-rich repeat (LRR) protein
MNPTILGSLSILPSKISQLINLKYFNCSHNKITNLPSIIMKLNKLKNLHYDNN